MREKPTLPGKRGKKGLKNFLKTAALTGILLLNPGHGSAQGVRTLEENTDTGKKEKIEKIQAVEETNSTIVNRDEAKEGLEKSEGGEISHGEIQEYIKNHKSELTQAVDKEIADMVYKEVMNNPRIQSIVYKMVNDPKIRQAIFKGDKGYVEQEIKKNSEVVEESEFNGFAIAMGIDTILVAIIFGVIGYKKGKKSANKRETPENTEREKD